MQSDKFQKCFTACKLALFQVAVELYRDGMSFCYKIEFHYTQTIAFKDRVAIRFVTAMGFVHIKGILNILFSVIIIKSNM